MHVLVIEDEARIRRFVGDALKAEGHAVQSCSSYDEAQAAIEDPISFAFDAVILDRMLRDKDGTELIAPLKSRCPNCGILVLSALNTPEEKATVLDLGADDYLSKPFSLLELSARIRALSRRTKKLPGRLMLLKNCQIDLLAHEVRVNGKKIDLSSREYQVLSVFAQNPGRIFNKFQLLDQVWNTQHDIESNVVEVTINNLRRKMETVASELHILSKRNVGYWIEA